MTIKQDPPSFCDKRQTEVKDANGTSIGKYYFDGEGKRVKKFIDATGETTIFVYSSGKLIAEYSNAALPSNPTTSYTTTDHLGSPRVITDALGQVRSRRDFLPFGEDLNSGVGGRTGDTGLKYSTTTDTIRQKFTGYQKDNETSLDFAEARMYENRYGRFTAVDPLLASGKSANPQTFNRYTYCLNNPLNMFDPDGNKPIWIYRYNPVTRRIGFLGIDSRDLRIYTKGKNPWTRFKGNLPYTYMSEAGYPVTLLPENRFVEHRSLESNFDDRNNPIEGWNAMGGILASASFGLLKMGDRDSSTYQNARGGADLVQIIAGAIFVTKGITTLTSIGIGAIYSSEGLATTLKGIYSALPSTSGECKEAATLTLEAFQKAGKSGEIVTITDSGLAATRTESQAAYLLDETGNVISNSNYHEAVKVGSRYYDALTGPGGATWKQYLKLWHEAHKDFLVAAPK